MAGLVPAIHVFNDATLKMRIPGTRPGMTNFDPALYFVGGLIQKNSQAFDVQNGCR